MSEQNLKILASQFQEQDQLVIKLEADLVEAKSNRLIAREAMLEAITRYDLDEA